MSASVSTTASAPGAPPPGMGGLPPLLAAFKTELRLSDEQAQRFRELYFLQSLPLSDALERIGVADERAAIRVLSKWLGMDALNSEDYPDKPILLEGVSMTFLRKHGVLPLALETGKARVAVSDPLDLALLGLLESYFGNMEIELALGQREDIRRAIDRLYGAAQREAEEMTDSAGVEDVGDDWERLKGMAQEAPIVRLVNMLISRALDMRASDIHFEPFKNSFKVRARVDGELFELDSPSQKMQPAILSRLKLMANLNIAERRLPQDGRISIKFGGRQVDIRVSTAPTLHGESVVLRLLSQEAQQYELESLGMDAGLLTQVEELIEAPYGFILVTGPTGSGKTTTLYGMLRKLNSTANKIITVEDPVEYQIEGVNQIQVKPSIDLTFASALRSLVRQDPDILLIGEIRDAETADIAIESALTGHLVLSTLHTNDAPGAITRLRDLGMESFLIADSMIAIMAQRLVRGLCQECREPYEAREADREMLAKAIPDLPEKITLYQSKGCARCGFTGYKGRIGIFELMRINEAARSGIVAGKDAGALAKIAWESGYRPLLHDGFRKALSGVTTLSEVLRATSFS